MTAAWSRALQLVAGAAENAAKRLEAVDLDSVPETIQRKVSQLWDERAEFVAGVQSLVQGLQNLEVLASNLAKKDDSLEARVLSLEQQVQVLRGRNGLPPTPPPVLEGVSLED